MRRMDLSHVCAMPSHVNGISKSQPPWWPAWTCPVATWCAVDGSWCRRHALRIPRIRPAITTAVWWLARAPSSTSRRSVVPRKSDEPRRTGAVSLANRSASPVLRSGPGRSPVRQLACADRDSPGGKGWALGSPRPQHPSDPIRSEHATGGLRRLRCTWGPRK